MESKKLYYPPGGILIWLIMILEMFTFLGAIMVFMYYRKENIEEFTNSASNLNAIIGTINSIILITSGYFIAQAILLIRDKENQKSARNIRVAMALGIAFLIIKGVEYSQKLDAGFGLEYDTFFTFYWLMTGFHFVHVLFGVGLLAYMYRGVKKNQYHSENYHDVESTAVYWHMCDLIWIFIFPVLYLI